MKNQNLLGSWQWYFVKIESQGEQLKFILDENQYENFLQRLEKGERHIKVGADYYFWSDIKRFWAIEFESGVLEAIKNLEPEQKNHVRNRIMDWYNLYTMEKLRSEIAYFLSR